VVSIKNAVFVDVIPCSSALKMAVERSSKTLVSISLTAWHHIREDSNLLTYFNQMIQSFVDSC
jgi:hypothetical protein